MAHFTLYTLNLCAYIHVHTYVRTCVGMFIFMNWDVGNGVGGRVNGWLTFCMLVRFNTVRTRLTFGISL